MSKFTKVYRKWHAKNNGKYDSAREYHKALMSNFKSWQPPKPLIVVPKFVADWLDNKSAYIIATSPIPKEVLKWSQGNTNFRDVAVNLSNLIEIKVIGYTVEKENLYILKHIDMSKLYTDVSLYLAHGFCKELEHIFYKDVNVHNVEQCHFTQKEIDKLNIGSYEKIPVEMSDNGI